MGTMAASGRPFTVNDTHGILLRPEHRIIAASDRLGWKSLYASMQREAPYGAAYVGVPDHLIILHLDGPVTVSRVLGKSWASRIIPPGGLFMLPVGIDFWPNLYEGKAGFNYVPDRSKPRRTTVRDAAG